MSALAGDSSYSKQVVRCFSVMMLYLFLECVSKHWWPGTFRSGGGHGKKTWCLVISGVTTRFIYIRNLPRKGMLSDRILSQRGINFKFPGGV